MSARETGKDRGETERAQEKRKEDLEKRDIVTF